MGDLRGAPSLKRAKSLSAPAAAEVRQIAQRTVRNASEKKYFVAGYDANDIDYSGTVYDFSTMVQGTTYQTRSGLDVHYDKVDLRYQVRVADTSNMMRVIFFKFRQNTGLTSAPDNAVIFKGAINSALAPLLGYTVNEGISVLYDRLHTLDAGKPTELGRILLYSNKLGKTSFNAGSTTITGEGKLYMVVVSDSAAAANPVISINAEVYFTDH